MPAWVRHQQKLLSLIDNYITLGSMQSGIFD